MGFHLRQLAIYVASCSLATVSRYARDVCCRAHVSMRSLDHVALAGGVASCYSDCKDYPAMLGSSPTS